MPIDYFFKDLPSDGEDGKPLRLQETSYMAAGTKGHRFLNAILELSAPICSRMSSLAMAIGGRNTKIVMTGATTNRKLSSLWPFTRSS